MAYLKNEHNEIIVDAIVTKLGRQKLATEGKLDITKFSLSDDEVDYGLYNTNHPSGEFYFDVAIRELPVLEALPGNDEALKYLLFTSKDNSVSTVTTLEVSYPQIFIDGIIRKDTPYTFNPQLSPSPVPDLLKRVYYVAEIYDVAGASFDLEGLINPDYGQTNEILLAKQSYQSLQQKEMRATTTVYAVGHYFSFVLRGIPRYDRLYPVIVRAFGPVSTNEYKFNIKVKGFYQQQPSVDL